VNLFEFLTHTEVQLPSQWDDYRDFEKFLRQRFDIFLTLIDQLDPNVVSEEVQRRKASILTCCGEFCCSLRASFEGHSHEAYQHFDTAMQAILPEINALAFVVNGPGELGICTVCDNPSRLHCKRLICFTFPLSFAIWSQRNAIAFPAYPAFTSQDRFILAGKRWDDLRSTNYNVPLYG